MNISTLSNIAVALGTILLAYFTYKLASSTDKSINNSQNQLEFLKKQNEILMNQQNPYLQFTDLKFHKNTISFSIENIGEVNAYNVGVFWRFNPVLLVGLSEEGGKLGDLLKFPDEYKKAIVKDFYSNEYAPIQESVFLTSDYIKKSLEDPSSKISTLKKLYDSGKLKEHYPNLIFTHADLRILYSDNKGIIVHNGCINYPNTESPNFVIKPRERLNLECEPKNYLYYVSQSNSEKYLDEHLNLFKGNLKLASKIPVSLDELIEILKQNKVDFVNFIFELVYKNQYGKCSERITIKDFVFSVKDHSTLEQALKEGLKSGRFLVSQRDKENVLKIEPEDEYFGEYTWNSENIH